MNVNEGASHFMKYYKKKCLILSPLDFIFAPLKVFRIFLIIFEKDDNGDLTLKKIINHLVKI